MSLNFLYFVTKYVVYTSVKYLSRSPNSSKVIELKKMVLHEVFFFLALTKIGRFGINSYSWQIGSLTYPHVTQSARLIGRAADDIIGKAPEAQTPNSLITSWQQWAIMKECARKVFKEKSFIYIIA